MFTRKNTRKGDFRWGAAAWLIGLPLPIVILAFLFGGCNSLHSAPPAQVVNSQTSLR
jgi:hypothetical protein